MKEKILDAFKQLGFSLIKTDELGYGFSCEGTNLLYIPNSEDEDFLNISVPCVCDGESGRSIPLQELAERVNAMLKYVKAYRLGRTLWLFYERELLSEENLPQIISRMVVRLEAASCFVHYFLVANDNIQANIETGISVYGHQNELCKIERRKKCCLGLFIRELNENGISCECKTKCDIVLQTPYI